MAFTIKKRINTELFIDIKQRFTIQKWSGKSSVKIEKGKINWRETVMWERTQKPSARLECLTKQRNVKLMAACLKRLQICKSEKYRNVK